MRNLLEFLAKYNHWLLFLLLETVSVVMLFKYNSYQSSVCLTTANAVTGRVLQWSSSVETFFSMARANEQLTERNVALEQRVRQLEEELVSAVDTVSPGQVAALAQRGYSLTPAKVIGKSRIGKDNLITIDKGSLDGVEKDMGVVSGCGVVGTVYLTSEHYSIVIPILSSNSNVSVTIGRRGYYGYLHWTGGDPTKAYVDDVPRHAHFSIGDEIVTSGYSAIFPPGVIVGEVTCVFNSADGLSYRIETKLATDFGSLRDVCVISDARIREQATMMRAAADSLKTKHN